ncbi:MAG: cobalamin B12-binding domain protein [Bacillota bacterium]|jgi:methanogenic corrinoid protein MtbC1|nr:cobalamin B12-binding domain protein [Bacillota bacterium]
MEEFKKTFMTYFEANNKDMCVELTIKSLHKNAITIPDLYEKVLRPALYSIDDCVDKDNGCIWKEHVKTSIIKTVIESIYPFVIKLKKHVEPLNIKVIFVCPEKEYHEIGLRMMSDFFNLNGYDTIFIGTNSPRDQIITAILFSNPKYIAISVTDYYLLFEAQKMIQKIKSTYDKNIIVIVGGLAFKHNLDSVSIIGGDIYLETYEDVVSLAKEDLK